MIDVLETNKLRSAAAGISVEAKQTAGEATAESSGRSRSIHSTISKLPSRWQIVLMWFSL